MTYLILACFYFIFNIIRHKYSPTVLCVNIVHRSSVDRFSCTLIFCSTHILLKFYNIYEVHWTRPTYYYTVHNVHSVGPIRYINILYYILEIGNGAFVRILYDFVEAGRKYPLTDSELFVYYNSHYDVVVVTVRFLNFFPISQHALCTRADYILILYIIVLLFAQ